MILLAWLVLIFSALGVLGQGIHSIIGESTEERFLAVLDTVVNIVTFVFALLTIIGGK